jgi:hypothetical protein
MSIGQTRKRKKQLFGHSKVKLKFKGPKRKNFGGALKIKGKVYELSMYR